MSSRRYDARMRHVRRRRIRRKVAGSPDRPRLSVFRSGKHVYAQIIDDSASSTLAAASSLELDKKEQKTSMAVNVGKSIAERSLKAGITRVVFDRGGYLYHGRVKALADAAREGGLEF